MFIITHMAHGLIDRSWTKQTWISLLLLCTCGSSPLSQFLERCHVGQLIANWVSREAPGYSHTASDTPSGWSTHILITCSFKCLDSVGALVIVYSVHHHHYHKQAKQANTHQIPLPLSGLSALALHQLVSLPTSALVIPMHRIECICISWPGVLSIPSVRPVAFRV